MRRNKLIFLGFVLVVMLSGCWGQNEPERMLYTHGLGIDYEDDKYKVYVQIIDFNKVAKSEQPNPSPVQSEVGYASGKTLDEAVFKLYNSSDQKIYWGHQTFLVFSEEALKNGGMNDIIDTLIRYRDTRYQIWLFGTDNSVKEVLLTTPVIDTAITLSKLGDPMNSFHQSSLIEPVDIRRMIIGLNEPGHNMVIPYVKITENWETVEGKDKMARSAGVGLVTPNEFKGFIYREKMFGLMWMNEKTQREEVTFSLDSGEEDVMSVVIQKVKVKVKPVVEGDAVKFDIDVTLQGEVGTIPTKTTKDEIRKKAEQEIKEQIEETYKEALKRDFDIYRLSEYLYRKDVKEWKRLQQNGKVELAEDSIRTLNVKISELKPGRNLFKKTIE